MQPFNYQIQVRDPFESALSGLKLGVAERGVEEQRQQAALEQQAMQQNMERQRQLNSRIDTMLQGGLENATAQDIAAISLLSKPEASKQALESFRLLDQVKQRDTLQRGGALLSAVKNKQYNTADKILSDRLDALTNAGRPQDQAEIANIVKHRELLTTDPEAVQLEFSIGLASLGKEGQEVLERILPPPKEGFRMLTATEVKERELPPGPYQISPKGEVKPVIAGPLATATATAGDKRDTLALKELDIPRAKEFSDAAASARKLAQDSRVIANLLKGQGGGGIVKLTTGIQRDFGFESDRVTAADLVNALATRGAVQIRAPGSGATSDLEFKSYLQAFPSLANSERGRELMAKYSEAFAKRSARLADHARKLIREDRYSEEEISRFDDSLGSVLGEDFYEFAQPGRRQGVPQFTPQGAAPLRSPTAAPSTAPSSFRERADAILRQRNQ